MTERQIEIKMKVKCEETEDELIIQLPQFKEGDKLELEIGEDE